MPEARKPCPCPKCNGALVTSRTVRNHASRITPSFVPSFSAWAAAGYHKRPYPSYLLDNEDSDGETGGPSKNRTISLKRHQHQVITDETTLSLNQSNQVAAPVQNSKTYQSSNGSNHASAPQPPLSSPSAPIPSKSMTALCSNVIPETTTITAAASSPFSRSPTTGATLQSTPVLSSVSEASKLPPSTPSFPFEESHQPPSTVSATLPESPLSSKSMQLPDSSNDSDDLNMLVQPASGDSSVEQQSERPQARKFVNPLAGISIWKPSFEVPNTSVPSAHPPPSTARGSKSGKLMVASPTLLSARNLFALDYLKEHSPTSSEFKIVWDNVGSETKRKYEALSKERKLAARIAH